ncbi:hypothetical protein GCM10011376_04840 [Nocardioides flavus (ex Wang et al. 2016)]|uniref:Heavy-metal-associated domain-containing protein n=1 Tax=Nocardioides flavus (ex Wang et al. 2016) TaxID=2058780 RepID=A0ABQ3HIB2_9ACTN|nr:hypothetical protein [Nocardioides flavus (ex Wang et al. 2016)]GHE15644.1 hypothetical protein GCM10011376_04840 [Nocardioides flavus (ex Wang et al. 2016)]
MSTPLRVAAFVAALAAAFAVAWGGGRLVGPEIGDLSASASEQTGHRVERVDGNHDSTVAPASGLTARADGFTLALADRTLPAGRTRLEFSVLTSSGRPLLDYTREHEKDLHLIVVRRDLTGFQHVHPRLDRATGTWSVDVRLTPGTWRVIADLVPEGWDAITLADDVAVGGELTPAELPGDDRTATVATDEGTYTVTLEGDTAPGAPTVLTTRVELDGEPVTDLEPYLGAFGHLVAIRAGDLGYLHVHPEDGGPGPGIDFATAFPEPATYRLFLDFQHRGAVRTAGFTVESGGAPSGSGSGSGSGHEEDDDHDH